jgi:hypothetical protein
VRGLEFARALIGLSIKRPRTPLAHSGRAVLRTTTHETTLPRLAPAPTPYLLIEPRDSELLRDSYVSIRHGCAATLGLRQFAKEALKSGGRHKNQEATSPWHHPPLRVRNAARSERNLAGTDMELIVAHLDYVLTFEHVPQFVFVLMNVKRRVERIDFFNDGERSAGRICGGPDYELGIAESEAFTATCIKFEAPTCLTPPL